MGKREQGGKEDMRWLRCTCDHEFQSAQSKKYFRVSYKRLHNSCTQGYRCTVCGNVKAK